MSVNDSILRQWNTWKYMYQNSSDPDLRRKSLDNMQALDIQDDGQKNNSIDSSMNVWDIQDASADGTNAGQEHGQGAGENPPPETTRQFDNWWNQLPDDVKAKLKEKFAGDDGVFSDEEKGKAVDFMKPHAWTDDVISPGDIDNLRKELGPTGAHDTADTGRTFDAWMSQLPDPVKTRLKERFAGNDGVFSDEEKAKANAYIKDRAGGDNTLSQAEIDALYTSLDDAVNARDMLEAWRAQLPPDVWQKIKERYARPDGAFTEEGALKAYEYIKSKAGEDNAISRFDVIALRKDLGTSDADMTQDDIDKLFDGWMKTLPEPIRNKLKEKFAGEDGVYSPEEKARLVKYVGDIAGYGREHGPGDLDRLERAVGIKNRPTYGAAEVEQRFSDWMNALPEDIVRKLKQHFAGSDGEFDGAEKKKLLEWLDLTIGPAISNKSISSLRDALGVKGSELTQDEINKKFDTWMARLPDDARDKLKAKFAGADGVYSDAEKAKLIQYFATHGTSGNDITDDDVAAILESLGLKK